MSTTSASLYNIPDLLPDSAALINNRLHIGGLSVDQLATDYGSPLYVLDYATIIRQFNKLVTAFGSVNHEIIYAGKACLTIGIAQLMHRLGASIDVVSLGELETCLRANVPGRQMVMHGNNKSADELAAAIAHGVRIIVDSRAEFDRIVTLIQTQPTVTVDILLRVNPDIQTKTHVFIQTGQKSAKFGMPVDDVIALAGDTQSYDQINLVGLHSHLGSQLTDIVAYRTLGKKMADLMIHLRDTCGLVLPQLNVGGGFGVVYTAADHPVDIAGIITAIVQSVTDTLRTAQYPCPKLLIEPGRFLIAQAGVTLYRVADLKQAGDTAYIVVDGGMADNPRPMIYNAPHSFMTSQTTPSESRDRPYSIVGKFCESGDKLAENYPMGAVNPGDLLVMCTTGAYTYSMASNYNRYCKPAMILVHNTTAHVLVRRETVADVLRQDNRLDAI